MNSEKILEYLKMPKVIIGLIIAAVLLFGTVSTITTYTSIRNEGRSQELAMTSHWKNTQSRYGQFRLGMADKLTIAREKRDAINKILVDAVSGRYDKAGQAGTVDQAAVFSAIVEKYPDLKGLDIFDTLLRDIQAGREAFAKDQEQMADMVRSYNSWRTTGSFLHPTFVNWAGFPSDVLEVTVGDKVYRGQNALDKMSKVIVGQDTNEIFDTGNDKPVGK
ncbi:MAG: hypothetical protein IAF58_04910 [Leptolyngbya sp.]|nr:hypothetical protein [Candidatus Melainabacteria bacterium]